MKIQDCQMDIACTRSASEEREASASVQARSEGTWKSFRDMVESYRKDGKTLPDEVTDVLGRPQDIPESWQAGALASAGEDRRRRVEMLLREMLNRLFALLSAKPGEACQEGTSSSLPDLGQAGASPEAAAPVAAPLPPRAQVTLVSWEASASLRIKEQESTSVCARGSVQTRDGRCIDFDLQVNMARQYEAESTLTASGTQVALKDPLVLNFDGNAAELADTRFDFDLDSDGRSESVAGLKGGSAFLALDRNGDGAINNGQELFGARSGNGLSELQQYDSDGNHWIDEADAIYSQLRIWRPGSKSESGGPVTERLQTLEEAGVGALWLGSAKSEFSLKDKDNHLQGQVRHTGVWLEENGRAHSLQQVDLATTPDSAASTPAA